MYKTLVNQPRIDHAIGRKKKWNPRNSGNVSEKKKGESRRFSFSQKRSGTGCSGRGEGQGCSCSGDWTARRVAGGLLGTHGRHVVGQPDLRSRAQGSSTNRNTVERERVREGGSEREREYGVFVVVEVR